MMQLMPIKLTLEVRAVKQRSSPKADKTRTVVFDTHGIGMPCSSPSKVKVASYRGTAGDVSTFPTEMLHATKALGIEVSTMVLTDADRRCGQRCDTRNAGGLGNDTETLLEPTTRSRTHPTENVSGSVEKD